MSPIPPFAPPPLPGQTGNSGKYLTTNGSVSSWGTVSSGQAPWDAIVASSGGTHTTLGAAVAAASSGWRILVLNSTTETGTISSSLTNLFIQGINKFDCLIGMSGGAYNLTLSGAGVTVCHLGVSFGTGGGNWQMSGADSFNFDCYVLTAGVPPTNGTYGSTGANHRVIQMKFVSTYASTTASNPYYTTTGTGNSCTDSYFSAIANGTAATTAIIRITGSDAKFVNNEVSFPAIKDTGFGVSFNAANGRVIGNVFRDETISDVGFTALTVQGAEAVAIGNKISAGNVGISLTSTDIACIGNTIHLWSDNATVKGIESTSTGDTIVGNTVVQLGTLSGSGIYITSDDNTISANRVRNFTNGVNLVSSAADRNVVTGNNLMDNTVAILDAGTDTTMTDNTFASLVLSKKILYMKNTSGSTINAGNIVTWKAVAAGNEITTTATVSDNYLFGMATAAISNNASGFVQVAGKTTLLTVNGTVDIAIGDYITSYSAAGIGAKAAVGTVGTLPGDLAIAIALEAYTGNDSNGVIDAIIIPARRL